HRHEGLCVEDDKILVFSVEERDIEGHFSSGKRLFITDVGAPASFLLQIRITEAGEEQLIEARSLEACSVAGMQPAAELLQPVSERSAIGRLSAERCIIVVPQTDG